MGRYYVPGTRISLDSVVYSFRRGNAPEAIQQEVPLLRLVEIHGPSPLSGPPERGG